MKFCLTALHSSVFGKVRELGEVIKYACAVWSSKLITPSSIGQLMVVYSHHYSVTVQLIWHKASIAWWGTNQNDAGPIRPHTQWQAQHKTVVHCSDRGPLGTWSPTKYKPSIVKGRPLRIINVNCQSLIGKKGALRNLLETTKSDIIIATRTWLNSGISAAELECDDFIIYRKDRAYSTHGGVPIAVNSMITSTEVSV